MKNIITVVTYSPFITVPLNNLKLFKIRTIHGRNYTMRKNARNAENSNSSIMAYFIIFQSVMSAQGGKEKMLVSLLLVP